ncbi:MAG: PDZ domain-containing protein [Nanoarchaeota archaeon]
MGLMEFLKPNKTKIIIALILPIVFELLIFLFRIYINTLDKNAFAPLMPGINLNPSFIGIVIFLISRILISVYHYPLACFIATLIKGGMASITAKNVLLFVILLAIFNPLTLTIILILPLFFFVMTKASSTGVPCGVLALSVDPDSPAQKAGFVSGDKIDYINDELIKSLDDFNNKINQFKPGDKLNWTTMGVERVKATNSTRSYPRVVNKTVEIIVGQINQNLPYFGIKVKQVYCKSIG